MLLISKETVFEELNQLGLEQVQAMRNRGEDLGPDVFVREWLEVRGLKRLEEGHELQKRAVAASERSAAASEHAADASKFASRMAAITALISLVAILVTLAKEWGWFN